MTQLEYVMEVLQDVDRAEVDADTILPDLAPYIRRVLRHYEQDDYTYSSSREKGALEIIVQAMNDYIEEYHAPEYYRQKLYDRCCFWCREIAEAQGISKEILQEILDDRLERPVAFDVVDLIKQLHPQKNEGGSVGVSKQDLRERYAAHFRNRNAHCQRVKKNQDRTILSMLKRLEDPSTSCYRIGGQAVHIKISHKDEKEGDYLRSEHSEQQKIRRYYTENTLHPLVLQANLMQAGTLLEALYRLNRDTDSQVAYELAADIWCQLSDYGQLRLMDTFGERDPELRDFFDELNDEVENGRPMVFLTEQEMMGDNTNIRDRLMNAFKGGTVCAVRYRDEHGQRRERRHQRIFLQHGNYAPHYYIVDADQRDTGERIWLTEEQVIAVEPEKQD